LSSESVAKVVAVEVHGGDHVELVGAGEDLLEGDVGDGVSEDEFFFSTCRTRGSSKCF
jgi:hypothetical protein